MRRAPLLASAALAAALALSLVACADGGTTTDAGVTTVPSPSVVEPELPAGGESGSTADAPSEVPVDEPAPTCASMTADEAFAASIDDVPKPEFLAAHTWIALGNAPETYDPCAELSWIITLPSGATVSTPTHVMLFHRGEYVGTVTDYAYDFMVTVTRIDDGTLDAMYLFLQEGDGSHAEVSGRTHVTLTWNPATQSVDLDGELPPMSY